MDVGLNNRAIQAQLATTREVILTGEFDDVVEELLQGVRLDEIGPAQQRGVVRRLLGVEAAELAQDQAI